MDNKERFDQLEGLFVDFSRKLDQLSEAVAQQGAAITQQGAAIAQQGAAIIQQGEAILKLGEAVMRQETRLDNLSEQINDVINILKISAAAHRDTERQQKEFLTEMREQGQRHGETLDTIKALLNRAEATDKRLGGVVESQRQLIQLAQLNTESIEDQEPRIQRLENEVFQKAS